MDQMERVREKILKIQIINKEDIVRYELYAIFTTIILSKELLHKNKDVVNFLSKFDIIIKPYMGKNRTAMLSKTLREINKAEYENLNNYKKILGAIFLIEKSEKKTTKSNNYMEDLLNRYSRDKR